MCIVSGSGKRLGAIGEDRERLEVIALVCLNNYRQISRVSHPTGDLGNSALLFTPHPERFPDLCPYLILLLLPR